MICPFTGRTGTRSPSTGSASRWLQAPAASTTSPACRRSPAPLRTPVTRVPARSSSRPLTGVCSCRATPARSHARLRAESTSRGSTEWSSGHSIAARTVGASAGSRSRASLGSNLLTRSCSELRSSSWRCELARLVVVPRHHQRPVRVQGRAGAGRARELGDEPRPGRGGPQAEPERAACGGAELDLRHRGEHPGGDAGRGTSQLVALQQRHRHAPLARAPGDGETDDPAAHDQHVEALACDRRR